MSELEKCQSTNTDCGFAKMKAERDRFATDLAEQCVRNAELIAERDALAARVLEMREALDMTYLLEISGGAYYDFDELRTKSLATPDTSAAILARRDAAVWMEAAEVCTDLSCIDPKDSCAEALRAKAESLEKEYGN